MDDSNGNNGERSRRKTLSELIGITLAVDEEPPAAKKQKLDSGSSRNEDEDEDESSTSSEEEGKGTKYILPEPGNEEPQQQLPHSNVLFNLFDTRGNDYGLDDDVAEFLFPPQRPALTAQSVIEQRARAEGDAYKIYRAHRLRRKQKWSQRLYDLRSEQDVGNAIRNQVSAVLPDFVESTNTTANDTNAMVLEDASSEEEEKEKEQEMEEEQIKHQDADKISEKSVAEEEDGIGTQQSSILDQLLLGSQQSQTQNTEAEEETRIVPSIDNLDWWQMGYMAPKEDTVPSLPMPVPSIRGNKKKPPPPPLADDKDDEKILSVPFRLQQLKTKPFTTGFNPHERFPLSARTDPTMNLNRLWLALAARMVACGASTSEQLAVLWKLRPDATYANRGQFAVGDGENDRQFTNQSLMEHCANHLGRRMMMFLTTKWHSRTQAAQTLTGIPDTAYLPTARAKYLPPRHIRDNRIGSQKLQDITTTRYVHLPGTNPPIPQFPLEYDEILWGPTDRFQDVKHDFNGTAIIYEPVYKITLAALVAADAIDTARELMEHVVAVNQSSVFCKVNYAYPQHSYYLAVANAAALDEEPCQFLDGVVTDEQKLGLFRKLHLSHTLTSIASVVPEDAAEFMKEESDLPPVEFIRTLLEDTIDYDECDRHRLENELSKHGDQSNVQKNPTDSRWYAWRLAILAGNLFLCGGGGASNSDEAMLSQMLEETRRELAETLLLLEKLSHQHHRESACAHEAIQTLLEWRFVAALLFGQQHVDNVHALHSFHTRRLREICMTPETIATADSPCEKAFLELEKFPDVREHWEHLAECLGTLGCTETDHCNGCATGCSLLRDGMHSKAQHPFWCGREWWRNCLLAPLLCRPELSLVDAQDEIVPAIGKVQNGVTATFPTSNFNEESLDAPSINWLDFFVFHIGSTKSVEGEELAAAIEDMPVPRTGTKRSSNMTSLELGDVTDHLTVVTCKILLLGHLGLMDDEDVGALVLELLRCGWIDSELTEECQLCVECLVRYGVDFNKVFLRAIQHYWNRLLRKA